VLITINNIIYSYQHNRNPFRMINEWISIVLITINNIIYSYQHNRNPFIDHPEFVQKLYGASLLSVSDEVNQPFYTLNYTIEIDVYTIKALTDKKEYYNF